MPNGDNELWGEARCVEPYNAIYKDDNIEVSNGTIKLKVKKENTSWKCDTCSNTYTTQYSNATIATPYTMSFNTGKFEARIKMPTFKKAHCTFWTWHGNKVNEIDIAESYGVGKYGSLWGDFSRTNYSLHSWPPGDNDSTNPYHLSHHEIKNRYPAQSWWHWLSNSKFNQEDFHIYGCEWYTNSVHFFVDGIKVNSFWKYYQTRKFTQNKQSNKRTYNYIVGSDCIPSSGDWYILPGYPWNDTSYSNLRFTAGLDGAHDSYNDGVLGAMEIDYLKVWQQHPNNGWYEIQHENNTHGINDKEYNNKILAEQSDANIVVSRTIYTEENLYNYQLNANSFNIDEDSCITYEWDIYYGPQLSQHYNAKGQFIFTTSLPFTAKEVANIQWQLKITHHGTQTIKSGAFNYLTHDKHQNNATSDIYVCAVIDDITTYENAVDKRLQNTMISVNATILLVVNNRKNKWKF
jgi:hypothetical protein